MPEPRIALGSSDSEHAPDGGVSVANARSLARWWARSANGVLRVECVVDGAEQAALVLLAAGGPVGLDGMEGIELALRGGTLSFDPLEADEPGDREAMAQALWDAARRMVGAEALDPDLVVMPGASPALGSSPLEGTLAVALLAMEEPAPLVALADRVGLHIDRVVDELGVTTWLGLTTLKEAHTLLERRQRPMAPPAITVPKSTFAGATLPPRPPAVPPAEPLSEDTRPDVSLHRGVAGPNRSTFGPRPAQQTQSPASQPIPISRLQREAELLRHADGWTALGIPRGAAREMIVASASRMRDRYAALQRDPNPDARGYALEILRRVADAERSLLSADADDRTDPAAAEHVAAGGVALERNDFSKADKHFSAARRHAPNDAAILAQLAWARFKNPEHKRLAREEEAVELVALALQFDAECAQAWRCKGEIARARGDMDAARVAMQTAARLGKR